MSFAPDVKPGEERDIHFLPSEAGRRTILLAYGSATDRDVVLMHPESGELQVVAEGAFPIYSPSGHIIYQTGPQRPGLWALPFSLETLQPTGEAFSIAPHGASPSVSSDGTLVYIDLFVGAKRQLVWRDREGKKLGVIGQPQDLIRVPSLSPDERRVAASGTEGEEIAIWVHEVERPLKTRLTFEPGDQGFLAWSLSGTEIAYLSRSDEGPKVFRRAADGTGEPALIEQSERPRWVTDWSHDGRYLLYTTTGAETKLDLGYLERNGGNGQFEAVPFLDTAHGERLAKLSPDGRHVAYCSDESGRDEVYVRSFPDGGERLRISENSGCGPLWSSDGEELFYVEADETIFAVPIKTTPQFTAGRPIELFSHEGFVGNIPDYDVSADGERFVLVEAEALRGNDAQDQPAKLHVVQNWYEEFCDRERE